MPESVNFEVRGKSLASFLALDPLLVVTDIQRWAMGKSDRDCYARTDYVAGLLCADAIKIRDF